MPSTSHFWQGVPISFPTLHATHSSVEDCPCLVEVSNSGVKSKLSAQLHMLHTLCYVVHTSQSPLRAIGKQCCTLLVALYHPPSSRQPSRLQVHPQAPQTEEQSGAQDPVAHWLQALQPRPQKTLPRRRQLAAFLEWHSSTLDITRELGGSFREWRRNFDTSSQKVSFRYLGKRCHHLHA